MLVQACLYFIMPVMFSYACLCLCYFLCIFMFVYVCLCLHACACLFIFVYLDKDNQAIDTYTQMIERNNNNIN